MAPFTRVIIVLGMLSFWISSSSSFTIYYPGDDGGWRQGVNYHDWALNKNFQINDVLVFSYPVNSHTVTEVTAEGYNQCNGTNPISNDSSGDTIIRLEKSGPHFFISTKPGDCPDGSMFLIVKVA